jgi:cyanophycin synthetase
VLNAADPIVVAMAQHCPGSVIFFAQNRMNPVLATQRAQGKRVVHVKRDAIVCCEGRRVHSIPLANIPITRNGAIGFQIENAMAAIATGWALGISWEVIERALAGFVNDAQTAPGRFNVFDYKGATLIADYGHNPDAIQALGDGIANMPARRRSVVISGAGDRRDDDIRQQTQILGAAFDDVVLYQDACQRGREDGEVIALLREGLANARRTRQIDAITGEFLAIDTALARLQAGDLCLILIDQVEEALAHIARRVAEV